MKHIVLILCLLCMGGTCNVFSQKIVYIKGFVEHGVDKDILASHIKKAKEARKKGHAISYTDDHSSHSVFYIFRKDSSDCPSSSVDDFLHMVKKIRNNVSQENYYDFRFPLPSFIYEGKPFLQKDVLSFMKKNNLELKGLTVAQESTISSPCECLTCFHVENFNTKYKYKKKLDDERFFNLYYIEGYAVEIKYNREDEFGYELVKKDDAELIHVGLSTNIPSFYAYYFFDLRKMDLIDVR